MIHALQKHVLLLLLQVFLSSTKVFQYFFCTKDGTCFAFAGFFTTRCLGVGLSGRLTCCIFCHKGVYGAVAIGRIRINRDCSGFDRSAGLFMSDMSLYFVLFLYGWACDSS